MENTHWSAHYKVSKQGTVSICSTCVHIARGYKTDDLSKNFPHCFPVKKDSTRYMYICTFTIVWFSMRCYRKFCKIHCFFKKIHCTHYTAIAEQIKAANRCWCLAQFMQLVDNSKSYCIVGAQMFTEATLTSRCYPVVQQPTSSQVWAFCFRIFTALTHIGRQECNNGCAWSDGWHFHTSLMTVRHQLACTISP